MKLLSGKKLTSSMYEELETTVKSLKTVPGLGVILVGEQKDSETYVRMKTKKCQELGIFHVQINLPEDVSQEVLIQQVEELNNDSRIDGILIQLPLPKHIDEDSVLNKVKLEKDVDGFHYLNAGRLSLNKSPSFVPCTPDGILKLIQSVCSDISGKNAVVIGRSRIVGMPIALLLSHQNATVTICHSRTQNLPEFVKNSDIVVVACGRPRMVKGEWFKKDAIVIDVGINSIEDKSTKRGYRLVGDVDLTSISEDQDVTITPVPGGVGPMTICMLMTHVTQSAIRNQSQ